MKYKIILLAILISGCASNKSLYFGTYTRIGIDASSDGVGIGAKNAALNTAPAKKDGGAFDVLGTSDLDIAYTNTVIEEVVAVGQAAICAAQKAPVADNVKAFTELLPKPSEGGSVIFGTYSSWSLLDLSWGGATSTGINFGYKRGTGVKMPIVNDNVGSVYASISVNTTDDDLVAPKTNIGGTRNVHTFATGEAAIIKASEESRALNGNDAAYAGCLSL
ncbi:hypothetical protein [Pseudohongiella sp.]|uniref:Uncharacterized protein n=1 Tax=marine sediment metagenome TaxID=412755 RepID=A0A0F9Z4B1_9ZZZZ|nr:hypothetical protein [Pseudohongiella sp.]HDZ07847.1 hypothetical protein [Pseudohongiella sp.]